MKIRLWQKRLYPVKLSNMLKERETMYIDHRPLEDLYQLLTDFDTIIIHRHIRPDPDALGSQLGLKHLILNRWPDKRVLAAGTTTPGLAWLGKMDQVVPADYEGALVIVVDTANQSRVDGQDFDKGDKLVKIDHHIEVDTYGDLQIVHTQASSASEMVALIAHYFGERLPLDKETATIIYSGIVGDTGRFTFATTRDTFLAASYLMEYDVDTSLVVDRFSERSSALTRFLGYIYSNIQVLPSGTAFIKISRALIEKFGISEEETNAAVNVARDIIGVYTWVNFIQFEDNLDKWRVRLRSKGPEINSLAQKHGGGGHAMASGATAYGLEEVETIIKELSDLTAAYRAQQHKNQIKS